jgi:hypothetical protein
MSKTADPGLAVHFFSSSQHSSADFVGAKAISESAEATSTAGSSTSTIGVA